MDERMSFQKWYEKHKTSVWVAMPWIKDDLKDAYLAGRKSAKKAHIAQPAQAVDVGAVREVIEDMRNYDADMPLAADHWIDKLTRAIGNAQAEGWMDIATAPKGGGAEYVTDPNWVEPPSILLRFGEEGLSVAYWDWYYAEGGNGCTDGFAWIEPCSGDQLNLHFSTPPDGWMPIPTPPTKATPNAHE